MLIIHNYYRIVGDLMILGRGVFGYSGVPFDTVPYLTNFYRLEIQNAIFDEVKIDDSISEVYSSIKGDWEYNTIFDYLGDNTLEAGNVKNKGVAIEKILFQKRKSDEYEWMPVAEFDFNALNKIYTYLDTYIENDAEYEYCLVPLTVNVTGNRTIKSFTPTFDGVFLTDKNNNFQLLYNLQQGEIENVNPSYIYETLGNQYPIIGYSSLDYNKTNIKAMVVDADDIDIVNLTPQIQKKKRDNLLKFLKNHKPKLFRSTNGEFMMVCVTSNPKFSPNNDLQGVIGDISFDITETNEINTTTLVNNGF
jgi:hypothetical protein